MFGKTVSRLVFAAALLAGGAAAWAADPTVDQVYQAAKAGNYSQAQSMMDQVLRDHPNSAKAHFIEAELMARQGKIAAARSEFETAQKLDPNLSFANPSSVQELKALLSSGSGARPLASGGFHVPWGPLLIVLAIFALVLMYLRVRAQRTFGPVRYGPGGYRPASPVPGGPVGPAGYGPGGATMAPPPAGGMGSGILGGLATGAAVGAGMVAGEALAHRVLGEGAAHHAASPLSDPADFAQNDTGNYDMGGNDFGVNDTGSWDDGGSGGSWSDSGGSNDDWS
jgi:hypothetical protein